MNEFINRHISRFAFISGCYGRAMEVQIILVSNTRHIQFVFIVHFFFFFSSSSKFEPTRPTDQRNGNNNKEHTNEQPRITAREMKEMKRNETRVSGNKSKSNHTHTHTLTDTMFKNITKSECACVFGEDLAIDPLRNDIPLVLVVRSVVRLCVFCFCFRLKLFMNDKK